MKNITAVSVNLGERKYRILLGKGISRQAALQFKKNHAYSAACIITESIVYRNQARLIRNLAQALGTNDIYKMPAGESHKDIEAWNRILTHLFERRYDRNALLIAAGGGVVGDVAGFAAASYMRGIDCVQVPTTLLAMVDSSVGGKTAVNHPLGKNMIGAFWQPKEVWIDLAALATLPERQYNAGMAEVVKHAFIGGPSFFRFVHGSLSKLMRRNSPALLEAVRRSCTFKAFVVEKDERESGVRALLNYGHTFGHAIEKCAGFGLLLHGEAITHGMMAAAACAEMLGMVDARFVSTHNALCAALCPPAIPRVSIAALMSAMTHDKKVRAGNIRLVLPCGRGKATLRDNVPTEIIKKAWETIL